jgi:predicted MFS family arabinose efflux permease
MEAERKTPSGPAISALDRAASTPEVAARQRPRELILLLLLAAVQFTSIVDFMVVMPLGPQLQQTLSIDAHQFGLVVASYTLSAGLAGLLASTFLDRFSRRRAYLTLFSGFLVGTFLCGLSFNYATLLCSRIVTGAFGGILGGVALAIVGDIFPEERRGQATGILMSAFALASVVGVPVCLELGTRYGWQVPFLILAAWGAPILLLVFRYLPPLRDHLDGRAHAHPWIRLRETFSQPNHLRAFAFTFALMFGGFSVIPFISLYLVGNAGVTQANLTWVYVTGGFLTLVGAPLIGRLADQFGKHPVYRIVAMIAAALMIAVTNLPRVSLGLAVAAVGCLMLCNAGRMTAGLAIVTGSVAPNRRGGFMSANSAVQHLASGLGALVGGSIIITAPDRSLSRFGWVGILAMSATLLSLWLVGLVRPAGAGRLSEAAFDDRSAADSLASNPA